MSARTGFPRSGLLRLVLLGLGGALVAGTLLFQRTHSTHDIQVLLEAEAADNVGPPLEIRREEVAFLHVPQSSEVQVTAAALPRTPRLTFQLPVAGQYFLWARTRWMNVCSNSIYVQLDAGPVLMLGNDELFEQWHWVPYARPVQLAAGRHTLSIPATESNVDVDQFLLADSAYPVFPGTQEVGFVEDFGSDAPKHWQGPAVENWDRGPLRLVTHRDGKLRYAVRSGLRLVEDFFLQAHAERTPGEAGQVDLILLFDHDGPERFRYVRISSEGIHLGDRRSGGTKESLLAPASPEVLGAVEGRTSWDPCLIVEGTQLRLWLAGRLQARATIPDRSGGELGVGSRMGGLEVSRVEVRVVRAPSFQNRFYLDNRPLKTVEGFQLVSGDWRRSDVYSGPFTYSLEARAAEGRAVAVGGKPWWTHYNLSSAVKLHAAAWAGLVFLYRDADDYFLLRVRAGGPEESRGEIQLARVEGGILRVLRQAPVEFPRDQWRILELELGDGTIRGGVDGQFEVEFAGVEPFPSLVGLEAEAPVQTHAQERPPVFFLEKRSASPFSFGVPLQLDAMDSGAALFFHYQDPRNYYRYGVARGEDGEMRVFLERSKDGLREILHSSRLKDDSLQVGNAGRDKTYTLGFSIKDGSIQTFLENQPVWKSPGLHWTDGLVGVLGLMPEAHAEFDEFRVGPLKRDDQGTGGRVYSFSPSREGARDLSAWQEQNGLWGIGLSTSDPFLYTLLGRTDRSGVAAIRNRVAFPRPARSILLKFRPQSLGTAQLEVVLAPRDREGAPLVMTFALDPATNGGDAGVRPLLSLREGTKEIARARAPSAWKEPSWQTLLLTIGEDGSAVVLLNDSPALQASIASRLPGDTLSLRVLGREGTVFGFGGVGVEMNP